MNRLSRQCISCVFPKGKNMTAIIFFKKCKPSQKFVKSAKNDKKAARQSIRQKDSLDGQVND